jgi:hypothetical protein
MTTVTILPRRPLAVVLTLVLGWLLVSGSASQASSHDGELYAQLDLPRGQVEFDLELGTMHYFDAENFPFAVQIIDGCAVNGHYWIFAAGLSTQSAPLTVIDGHSGQSERLVVPAFDPGEPIASVIETEALRLCRDEDSGGLPTISGLGSYTSSSPRCFDSTDSIELLSRGRDDAYRTLIRNGFESNRIVSSDPIIAIDESNTYDELHLLTEGRTPRLVEGVVLSGSEGMLPNTATLEKRLKDIRPGRVRRAFEAAYNGRLPEPLIEDLGIKGVGCVHHVSLDMTSLGADAYLAAAGWIEEGGAPLAPPELVDDRFDVEVLRANGESTPLALTGPFVGSREAGLLWRYEGDEIMAQLVDGCSLSGSFWTLAAARADEPVQLAITDTSSGASASHLLWTDRAETSWLADTASLDACS